MKGMTRHWFRIIVQCIFTGCVFEVPASYAVETDVEQQIRSEFLTLRELAMEPRTVLQIDRSSTGSSEVNTVKGILVFQLRELTTITAAIGKTYQRDMIRLIIAHELGHQMQYGTQSNRAGPLYECQADILAGYLLWRAEGAEQGIWLKNAGLTDARNANYQKKVAEWNDRFSASMTAIFRVGDNYVLKPSHPTSDQRRLALRDGYNYGNIWLFGDFLENDPVLSKSVNAPGMRERCKKFKALLGFLPGDNLIGWSNRHARKILHLSIDNCKDIIVYTNYAVDSTELYLHTDYLQQITNIGKKKITFSFYNQVYNSKRKDPANTLYWELLATAAHSITLLPGQTTSVQGRLNFLSTNDFTPTFIYPGKAGALFSCSTLYDTEDGGVIAASHFSGGKLQADKYILDAYLKSRDQLADLIGSVGISFNQESVRNIFYISRLQVAAARYTRITYDGLQQKYGLEVGYYHGGQKTKALQAVREVIKLLTPLQYRILQTPPGNGEQSAWQITDETNELLGRISMNYSPSFGNYDVLLIVFSVK
jgi:hypothetical protein